MSREQIVRDTAYAIWEAEGKPQGRDAEHWRLAEERVAATLAGQKDDAKAPAKSKPKAKEATSDAHAKTAPVAKSVKNAAAKAEPAPKKPGKGKI